MERGFTDEARDPELPFQLMRNGSIRNGSMRNRDSERSPSPQSIPYGASLSLMTPPASVPSAPQPGFKLQPSHRSANRTPSGPVLPQPPTPHHPTLIPASPPSGINGVTYRTTETGMNRIGTKTTRQSAPRSIAIAHPSVQTQPVPTSVEVKVVPVTVQSTPLPTPTEATVWVQTLIWVHRSIGMVTVALVLTALGFYGQSVYYQQQWGQSYRRLQRLKTLEYQGIAANEIMKHTLLEQAAKPGIAMRMPLPGTAISIQKVPPRALHIVEQPVPTQNVELDAPTGY